MKNKGFTIVELLATIVLIGIISLVALGSYSGIKKTIMKAQTGNVVSNIESTAIIYSTSRNKVGWIPLSELVSNEFIDKTDLERIDEYEDKLGNKCDLLVKDETTGDSIPNPSVGVFIGQKYAKTNVETEETDGVSASANLVKSADFYCVSQAGTQVDQEKEACLVEATSTRYGKYTLQLDTVTGYVRVHLSCTNGFYKTANEIKNITSISVNDLAPSDTCTLLFYHADDTDGNYIKHIYSMGGC